MFVSVHYPPPYTHTHTFSTFFHALYPNLTHHISRVFWFLIFAFSSTTPTHPPVGGGKGAVRPPTTAALPLFSTVITRAHVLRINSTIHHAYLYRPITEFPSGGRCPKAFDTYVHKYTYGMMVTIFPSTFFTVFLPSLQPQRHTDLFSSLNTREVLTCD